MAFRLTNSSSSAGPVTAAPGSAWHPGVIYLLVLIVAEMFVFGLIAKMLR